MAVFMTCLLGGVVRILFVSSHFALAHRVGIFCQRNPGDKAPAGLFPLLAGRTYLIEETH